MRYPLQNVQVVYDGQFGTDPQTYAQFNLAGHHGVDLIANIGTPVYAPEDATVYKSSNGTTDEYTGAPVSGEVIVLKGSMEHWLLHLSKRNVGVGDHVKEGQIIGISGATGYVTGPHLHWGVRPLYPRINNGYRGFIDPMEFMKGEEMADEDIIRKLYEVILNATPSAEEIKAYVGKPVSSVVLDMYKYAEDSGRSFKDTLNKATTADAAYVIKCYKNILGIVTNEKDPAVQSYIGKNKDYVFNDMTTWATNNKRDFASVRASLMDTPEGDKAQKFDEIKAIVEKEKS